MKKPWTSYNKNIHREKKAELDILLTDTPEQVHAIKFDAIDADLVKKAAFETRGRAWP